LLQAASLLRHGQADMAIVLAGDTLTQAVYEWYEVAQLLDPACFSQEPLSSAPGFVPSEGVVAMVLEAADRPASRPYAALGAGRWATGGDASAGVRQLLGDLQPDFIIYSAPSASSSSTCSARDLFDERATIFPAQTVAAGMGDSGGLLHILMALSKRPGSGQALLLGTSAHGGYAALRLELR
jgi:hypothetical protein